MEPKIDRTYPFYKSAKEIWDAIQEMYLDLENTSQCFEIRLAISKTRQGNPDVIEYYNVLTKLWHEMDLFYNISWECPANSTKYTKMLENDSVFDFLHGLNSDLDEVR